MIRSRRPVPRWLPVVAVVALLAVTACSSDDERTADEEGDVTSSESPADDRPDAPAADRPEGPAADVSEELTGGNGVFVGELSAVDLEAAGWVEHEYVAEGTATSYRSRGELPADGSYDLAEDSTAEYRTRIIVRRPADAAEFNGTVVVEWMNVSGGLDANPDWAMSHEELLRGGYAWVGVSAQHIGIAGGPVAVGVGVGGDAVGAGLTAIDPERYGSLEHPGDAYSYDIYTQVGRALRDGESDVLGDLRPERLLAVGESQSAYALTTYANGVQPLTHQFDGFLVHSRGAAAAPLGEPDTGIDMASSIVGAPTKIRTDLDVPVLVLETEGDLVSVLGYYAARQPDGERFRLWEIAGAAHADRHLVGPVADQVDCGVPINDGPHHFVVKSALRHLDEWVRDGTAPPSAAQVEIEGQTIQRDADGIALGGIRTPPVDVPVQTLSGDPGPEGSVICLLLGSTTPFPAERLAELYDSPEQYLAEYEQAADEVIEAGFVLPEDRQALIDAARPDLVVQ